MSYHFDDVTVLEENDRYAIIRYTQRDFDPARGHTAVATVENRALTVTARIGDRTYLHRTADLDIEDNPEVTVEKKHITVKVYKKKNFRMADKL